MKLPGTTEQAESSTYEIGLSQLNSTAETPTVKRYGALDHLELANETELKKMPYLSTIVNKTLSSTSVMRTKKFKLVRVPTYLDCESESEPSSIDLTL